MPPSHFEFIAIGTTWQITTSLKLSSREKTQILTRIETFDRTYSRFREDSLIRNIAKQKGVFTFPEDGRPLFSLYEKFYSLTRGHFTPLIGQMLLDAGYDPEYSLKSKELRSIPLWEDVMTYEFPNLTTQKPILLDFGAGGKGYLVDIIGEILRKTHASFSINAGGDILQKSTDGGKLRVGLEHPLHLDQVIGVAEIENGSICGSAGNRRAWGSFHHILHPFEKKSVSDILATWVVAPDGLHADALATALFFVPAKALTQEFDFSYTMIHKNLSLETSENFPATFY